MVDGAIAITGGIAEGKSTVLNMIEAEGFRVCSADTVAKVVAEDPVTQQMVAQALGSEQLLGKEELRHRVATDSDARRAVNQVVHPLVWDHLLTSGAQFIEVPLLMEACLQAEFNRVWVVTCGEDEQLRRLINRAGNEQIARGMIGSQLPTEVKSAFADQIIRTDRDLADVNVHVRTLLESCFA